MKDLIVGGYGLRNLPVGNKSDSGFVNSHSEADCRSYHRHLGKNLIWPVFKDSGVNKKPKKFKAVWHGFWGILKLSGRVNQASLKLSAGFSNTVC